METGTDLYVCSPISSIIDQIQLVSTEYKNPDPWMV